jgi:hypothetical protein
MLTPKAKVKSALKTAAARKPGESLAPRKLRIGTTVREKRLETVLVEVFRAHWRSVNAKIIRGVDVARNRAHMFFATNDRECLRVARRYYSPARAAKLATASVDEILRLSAPWLSAARESFFFPEEPSEVRKELRTLIAAEYIALVSSNESEWGCSVSPLPDESAYGDVYELTASGASVGASLTVCKTVAEPFLKSERREAEVGIEKEFFENARDSGDDAPWQVRFLKVTDPRTIDVEIGEV